MKRFSGRLPNGLLVAVLAMLPCSFTVGAATDLAGVWWIKDRSQNANVRHDRLPLLPDAAAAYQRNRAAVAAGKSVPIDQTRCLPEGMPRLMLARYPLQILQRPEQVTLLHERMHMVRLITMNRAHPEEPEPTYNGHSVGRWEGDTLVVETIGFNDATVIDATGIPHSGALRIVERFSLRDRGRTLRDVVTIEDPTTFSRPWSFTIDFDRRPEVRLMEDVCTFGPPQRDRSRP
jgi:hypothetical protein